MECPQCKAEASENSAFCNKCGKRIEPEMDSLTQSPTQALSGKEAGIVFGGCFLLIIVVAVCVGIWAASNSSDPPSSTESSTAAMVKKMPLVYQEFPNVAQALQGDTGDTPPKPKLHSLTYNPGMQTLTVSVNYGELLGWKWLDKSAIKTEAADVIIAFHKDMTGATRVPAEIVRVVFYGPLEDRFGNPSYGKFYAVSIDTGTLKLINWKSEQTDLEENVLPQNWSVDFDLNGSI